MQFIEEAARAKTPDAVIATLAKHLENRDVRYFSHRTVVGDLETVDHTTMRQDWLDHYYGSAYFRIDPGLQRVKTSRDPIVMSFDPAHPTYHAHGKARTMFAEMTTFGAAGSYFVPFQDHTTKAAASVNFITDCPGPQFDSWLDAHADMLRLYAVVTHTRISDLFDPAQRDIGNPLAPRERECLQWLAQGLLSERIAERMGISPRTVEFHLKNARSKLGASTREHALAKALMQGYISV